MLPPKQINFILYILAAITVQAQYKFEKAVNITIETGLPTHDVRSLSKDNKGFMWIATTEGLCRYDGTSVKNFREEKDSRYSLYDSYTTAVLAVNNKVWVGTRQGISVLNTDNYTFKHYQLSNNAKTDSIKKRYDQNISCLFKDKTGTIWIGTSERGVASYDSTKDNFKFYTLPPGKYPPLVPALGTSHSVLCIRESVTNDSIIWAGTTAGLMQINKYTGRTELFTFPREDKNLQVGLNAFRRIYHHSDGLLYTGGWAAGANVYDPVAKTITPLRSKSETGSTMLRSVIVSIFRKSENELWISTALGVVIYNTELKDITWHKPNTPEELKFYSIQYIDEAGRVWCADINGVNYYDPIMQQFSSFTYQTKSAFSFYILPGNDGTTITVCPRFTDGLFFFNKQTKEWIKKTFPGNEQFIKETDAVKGFVEYFPGEYVISSDKGVFKYSSRRNSIEKVNAGFPFGVARRADMLADKSGNVWICDNTWGLTKWNPVTQKFVNYKSITQPDIPDSTTLSTRLINLFEDSRGNIWFQMPGGIGVYHAGTGNIKVFNHLKREANSLPFANGFAEDKNGRVWIASTDGWLGYSYASEPEKGVVYKINIREKGVNQEIIRLAISPEGQLWGFTNKELLQINTYKVSFKKYDFDYGPMDMEIVSFSFLPTGEIVMGGRNNIFLINPADLKRNTELPLPYISELQVLNQPLPHSQIHQPLRLNYRKNFFSISFSSVAYTMAEGVKYRYRLSGFDDWSELSERRFANYTNVPGGDYFFQLQACNNEGLWNETILELPVHVATPYWQTWWFRTVLVLLAALIVYGTYLYRVNQFRKKEKLKSDYEKKIANVEMSSLLAQMNPHFLFNSLNSIDSYIIRNETHKASEYLNNFARLMRLILQNSRSNYITLKDELEALDLYLQMESLRFKNKFEYKITADEAINSSTVLIPPMLIQPFVENAIWHGLMHKQDGETGRVQVKINSDRNKLRCEVIDNGIGRNKAEEIKMQKTSGSHKRSMGMQITNDRIEMINKLYGTNTKVKITDLTDNDGNAAGTKVDLEIPV